jgi:hypothetical protein
MYAETEVIVTGLFSIFMRWATEATIGPSEPRVVLARKPLETQFSPAHGTAQLPTRRRSRAATTDAAAVGRTSLPLDDRRLMSVP